MKGKRLFDPALLLAAAVFLVFLTWQGGSLFGSSCDWFSQHVSIADTMRQTMREEGTLLIQKLPLGGGNNIYDFSYYGYLRPDVLLGCLLPQVPMEWIVSGYAIAGYLCSVLLFWLLLKKTGCGEGLSLFGGVLFLSAGCFFQIHRQIMFVNYMPFLLGALFCVRACEKKLYRVLLVLLLFLIELHSYYYSIACLFVIYLYYLYCAKWEKTGIGRQLVGLTLRYAGWGLTSVAMAGVLLLPTAASILNNMGKDGGVASRSPLEFHWNFEALLYDNYGIGLTMTVLFLLLLSIHRKKSRILASVLSFSLVCTLVPLLLNGFLYNRSKILMPFLPLVVLLAMETLREYQKERRRPPVWCMLVTAAVAVLQYQTHGVVLVFADGALAFLLFVWMRCQSKMSADVRLDASGAFWRRGKKAEAKSIRAALPDEAACAGSLNHGRLRARAAFLALAACICMVSYTFSVVLHHGDELLEEEKAKVSQFTEEERKDFYRQKEYRFDSVRAPYQTANRLLAYGAGRTSMYTSTANRAYSDFFYDEIGNAIGNNNRVGLFNRVNPFFLYLMGVRYLETTEEMLPTGYQAVEQKGSALLAERTDVLPLCYGSCDLLAESSYRQLSFPEKLEALTTRSIVSADGASERFASHFTRLDPKEGVDYEIRKESQNEYTIIPAKPVKDQILVIRFAVKRTSKAAVMITINGVTNKLSGASAPYPNRNQQFTYILSGEQAIEQFSVETSGSFEIGALEVYSLPSSYLGNRVVYPLSQQAAEGTEELKGTVTLPEDGYLITSLPMQKGYQVVVDGVNCPPETVNRAFLGVPLTAGTHEVIISYRPPLQLWGLLLSAAGWLFWGVLAALAVLDLCALGGRQKVRELFLYGIGGVVTTVVNYLVYFGLENVGLSYLAANTAAWAAAVAVSYCINRSIVFGSAGEWLSEFVSFAGLRLLTLAAENVLLYLLIGQLGLISSVSKIAVSIVTVLGNYVICKKHIFGKKTAKE